MSDYDVITLGETMLRLTPPDLRRIEQATQLGIEVGGSESNTAIGLARLGLRAAWISRLTSNALGRLICQTIASHGVDCSHVCWTDEDRIGLYFLEEGRPPRGSRVIYDRRNTAISNMQPEDLPAELFRPGGARLLHLTGITAGLGQGSRRTAAHALALARQAGWQVSFDLNYRSQLWAPEQALEACEPFAGQADLLFMPLRDARTLYRLPEQTSAEQAAEQLAARYPQATLVLTLGSQGALGRVPGGPPLRQACFPAEEVGRIGGGDAFVAGFLYGYLSAPEPGGQLARALAWGAAVAALKYSIPGDIPLVTRAEVEALLEQGGGGFVR